VYHQIKQKDEFWRLTGNPGQISDTEMKGQNMLVELLVELRENTRRETGSEDNNSEVMDSKDKNREV
jgi:hypothetical protein